MLSILIPTYNYNAFSLVEELNNQALATGIKYEIIVLDDGSTDKIFLKENAKINTLKNCSYDVLDKNIGRSAIRNLLAKTARYNWLLFMDCDTLPRKGKFIITYINAIAENNSIVFGGIAYKKEKPETERLLRWKYGTNREEINISERKNNPYNTTLTSNILIKKEVFDSVKFDKRINKYGYEDLVFIQYLKSKNYQIHHIDNATYHLNYEKSSEFLTKTKRALETLKYIEENNILISTETKIQKIYQLITRMKLSKVIIFIFSRFKNIAEHNLLSENPSLFVFDLYKLGYFCLIKSK
ncbi:Glycosyl transferase, group 2 family protein [Flavobacterium psychrophilum]|uniref:glycosyltransferase family 2 protein n=1 Tax=Flavobacterium psychrophilum TaxID=96345 RepID=UPI000B7C4016|nr:glycosyltransferase [Flavobacterium psychrophilum]GEJ30763.1 glycosyl transferase [Flavobacterium psychrophilum]GEJ48755.1 glycosyl transferase [Flavobacterium psychrophilum]SNB20851.1 Glycosyl transferase, group 2 family protein [Flavobacterium psychrophilum]